MNHSTKEHFDCESCDGETETKFVSYTFKRYGQEFTYPNIKAEVCKKCGEIYLDGSSVLEIEEDIKRKMMPKVA